jgi:HEAT repeat protein
LGDPSAIPALREAYLNGNEDLVLGEAASALGKIGGREAASVLIAIVENTDFFRNLRWPVARILSEVDDPRVYGVLIKVLDDEEDIVRENAAAALGSLSDVRAGSALQSCLKDADVAVRARAAEALGNIKYKEAVRDLLELLRDSHFMVREAAARAVIQIDTKELVAVVRQNVSDLDPSIRAHAARLLGELLGGESLPILLLLTRDADSSVRAGAAAGLSKITDERAGQALLSLVADSAAEVRRTAVEGIGLLRYDSAVPALVERLMTDESDLVRADSARVLGLLGDRLATEPLRRALGDQVIGVFAALALGYLGDVDAIVDLVAMFKRLRGSQYFRDWPATAIARIGGNSAVQALNQLLLTEDPEGRRIVVDALPITNEPDAVFGLLSGLTDTQATVRMAAREGLSRLTLRSLEIGLRQAILQSNPFVRREALKFLPAYADEQISTALEELLNSDTDEEVLAVASKALADLKRRWEEPGTGARRSGAE